MDILVNKEHLLARDYVPSNLIEYKEYNGKKINPLEKTLVEKECYEAFLIMQQDAKSQNIYLIIDSAYRSYDYQKEVFEFNVKLHGKEHTEKYVAMPGSSEHQTGLAIDFACYRNGEYTDDLKDADKEILYLQNNAYKFGFILRYPKGYENITGFNYEYWHYRYVGKEISIYMHDYNIPTLEQYYEQLHIR